MQAGQPGAEDKDGINATKLIATGIFLALGSALVTGAIELGRYVRRQRAARREQEDLDSVLFAGLEDAA